MKKIILFGDSIAAGLYQGEVVHALDHALSTTLKALGQADFKIINLEKKAIQRQAVLNDCLNFPKMNVQLTTSFLMLALMMQSIKEITKKTIEKTWNN